MELYVVFESTHEAMRLDRLLTDAGLAHELVPVPRALDSSCGVAVKLRPEDGPRARAAVESGRVRVKGFHEL